MQSIVRVNVAMREELWRRLRDVAEIERKRGPASVSRAIVRILEKHLERDGTVGVQRA